MGVFDELEQKAKELAAEAKAALENPDEFIAKTRVRVEEAVGDAKEDLEEFAADAKEEFKGFRDRMADFLDCDPKSGAASADAAAAPEAAPVGVEEPPPAPPAEEPS